MVWLALKQALVFLLIYFFPSLAKIYIISKELEMVPLLLTFLLLMPHSKERGEATDAIVSTIADVVCVPVLIQ